MVQKVDETRIMGDRRIRLQVLVTHNCNARCDHCDKAVGYTDFKDMEFTAEQMCIAVEQCLAQKITVVRVTLGGGEPILHPDLQGIINEAARLPGLKQGRVLTNDMPISKERRDKIVMPNKLWGWVAGPLDDPNDYKSGKNLPGIRVRNRVHHPYFVSPFDMGIESTWEKCGVRWWCGRGLDAGGWSMCGQAPVLGRILGIDPYPKGLPDIAEHVNKPIPEICKHCYYGMGRKVEKRVYRAVAGGYIRPMSKTFRDAFEKEPTQLVQISGGLDSADKVPSTACSSDSPPT